MADDLNVTLSFQAEGAGPVQASFSNLAKEARAAQAEINKLGSGAGAAGQGFAKGNQASDTFARSITSAGRAAQAAGAGIGQASAQVAALETSVKRAAEQLLNSFRGAVAAAGLDQAGARAAQSLVDGLMARLSTGLTSARQDLANGVIDLATFQRRGQEAGQVFAQSMNSVLAALPAQASQTIAGIENVAAAETQVSTGITAVTQASQELIATLAGLTTGTVSLEEASTARAWRQDGQRQSAYLSRSSASVFKSIATSRHQQPNRPPQSNVAPHFSQRFSLASSVIIGRVRLQADGF